MRKIFIAALVVAAGCDATRRDYDYCDRTYSECANGYVCDMTVGKCVSAQLADGGEPDAPSAPGEAGPPSDVLPGEAGGADAKDAPIIDVAPIDMSGIDGPVVDAPGGIDLPGPDTRVPDAAGTCSVDSDCSGGLSYCVNFRCVACKTSSHCDNSAGKPFCSAQNTCVSCAQATGGGVCTGATPMCDGDSGRCVECLANSSCTTPAKAFCVANTCQGCNVPGASSASGGGADGGVKDGGGVDAGAAAPACIGAKPVCATSGTMLGQCVQCLTSANCSGATPICNTTTNTCAACTADTQCAALGTGPGICMYHQDGRCASESETIYVKKTAGCSGGAGTAISPYCDTQAAVNAVTSTKRVLAVKGPAADALLPISSTPSGNPISIIGLNGATTAAGAAVGIHVTAGDVYIRGLTIANGSDRGILVEAGATVRMERCLILKNAGGGLKVQAGANFDIANTVFEDNGANTSSEVTPFGGILLGGSAPTTGPRRVWFSTIVNNQGRGVVCVDSAQALTGMLLYNNVGGGWANCAMDSTNSKWDSPGTGSDVSDPRFSTTNPHHLTASSRCKDFVDASLAHPTYDLDGDSRPYPTTGKLDCGADEYRP